MTWDDYFLELAATAAKKSKDPNCQVGVAIRGAHNETVATGFNGLPIGLSDRGLEDREKKLRRTLHAEVNALIFADPRKLAGATIYTTKPVCHHCAGVICQYHGLYGPLNIVQPPIDEASSWAESQREALETFAEARVQVRSATFDRQVESKAAALAEMQPTQQRLLRFASVESKSCWTCARGGRDLTVDEVCRACVVSYTPVRYWEPKQ